MPHDLTLQLDPDERVLYTLRRSFVGVIPHIVVALAIFAGLLFVVYFIARFPETVEQTMPQPIALAMALALALLIEIVIYLLITTYFRNVMVVTNQSVVQRLQSTPFSSSTSQLGLAKIEDVNVKQNGFFATTFNFGILTILTAGEQPNFIFKLAKDPKGAARVVIEAQEALAQPPPPAAQAT